MDILIAGDFIPNNRVADLLEKKEYNAVFKEAKQIVSSADYSILNLEAPIVVNDATPIDKTGPCHKSHYNAIEAISYTGFKCITLANNHFYDYGQVGVIDTITACRENGIDYVGGGTDICEAEKILYKIIGDKRVAFLNLCENEWSIASIGNGGSAPLDVVRNIKHLQEAKNNSDYVIVIVHGGIEHYQLPTPGAQELYRFFVDNGADAVINHHQHCYSGYELYNGKPIFYGLGNFCFDKGANASTKWCEGYMVMLHVLDNAIDFELLPYTQCADEPMVSFNKDRSLFEYRIHELNQIISEKQKLQDSLQEYAATKLSYLNALEPFNSKIVSSLRKHRLFPSFWKKKRKMLLLEFLRCESHREVLINLLKQTITK